MGAGMMLKANSVANKAGGYEREEQERKKYHGKGPRSRINRFARQKAEKYNDPVVDKEWTPAKNDREAFIQEAERIEKDGGIGANNYNKINSPGEKYRKH